MQSSYNTIIIRSNVPYDTPKCPKIVLWGYYFQFSQPKKRCILLNVAQKSCIPWK